MTKPKSGRPRSLWLRIYTGIMEDPKVMQLPCSHFKTWLLCLCMAKEGNGTLPSIEEIAFKLRVRVDVAQKHINALVEAGLIDSKDSNLTPHNWDKYQYASDVSTERVDHFRKRQRNVACNSSEQFLQPPQRTEYREQSIYAQQTEFAAADNSQQSTQLAPDPDPIPLEGRNGELSVGNPRSRRFVKPTPAEATAYANSIGFPLDGERFCDFYTARGWMVGKSPMKDWKAAIRNWRSNTSTTSIQGNLLNGKPDPHADIPLFDFKAEAEKRARIAAERLAEGQ